jgi:hypothetical protein
MIEPYPDQQTGKSVARRRAPRQDEHVIELRKPIVVPAAAAVPPARQQTAVSETAVAFQLS